MTEGCRIKVDGYWIVGYRMVMVMVMVHHGHDGPSPLSAWSMVGGRWTHGGRWTVDGVGDGKRFCGSNGRTTGASFDRRSMAMKKGGAKDGIGNKGKMMLMMM